MTAKSEQQASHARSRGRTERSGHQRRLARAPELRDVVAEQQTHPARAHRIGEPRAGGFADHDERHARSIAVRFTWPTFLLLVGWSTNP